MKRIKLPKRILILGAPATGKNFLAERISILARIKFYDLDDIYYRRKFDIPRPDHLRKRKLDRLSKNKSWIIGGLPFSWIGSALRRADMIIILKERFHIKVIRILMRSFRRRLKGEAINESLSGLVEFIHDSYHYFHKPTGKGSVSLREFQKAYGSKMIVLSSKKEVSEFLKSVN